MLPLCLFQPFQERIDQFPCKEGDKCKDKNHISSHLAPGIEQKINKKAIQQEPKKNSEHG